ncbi:hypothetical protein DPMN_069803 [Dreissena polymorpha]|uniref:Uncharacterized protein n=1 Tax=Dreissena polymorpha TaxID=45954 RepID=A0A9D4BX31_DREPO|nr:hypothetical protein DPMN_069803 [Dreissena polymorpha]
MSTDVKLTHPGPQNYASRGKPFSPDQLLAILRIRDWEVKGSIPSGSIPVLSSRNQELLLFPGNGLRSV